MIEYTIIIIILILILIVVAIRIVGCVIVIKCCMYTYTNTYTHIHMHVCVCIYIYIYIYMYMHICVCIHTCTYICVYIYICTYVLQVCLLSSRTASSRRSAAFRSFPSRGPVWTWTSKCSASGLPSSLLCHTIRKTGSIHHHLLPPNKSILVWGCCFKVLHKRII